MRRRISMRFTLNTKRIEIETLTVMEGALPRRAMAMVLEWGRVHQGELKEDWELCARNRTPKKIAPLA